MVIAARAPLRHLLGVAVCLGLLVACGGGADPVRAALEVVPDTALERTVLVTVGQEEGFGTALPAGALPQLLAMERADVRAIAETGGAPFTVVVGEVDADAAVAAAQERGYVAREIGAWWVLRPSEGATSPLASAIPALAVRDGVALLGNAAEVGAMVDDARSVASVAWVDRLVGQLGDVRALALGRPEQIAAAIEDSGEQLPDLPLDAPPLRPYDGYGLAWSEGATGRILLVRGPGDATTEDAAALAVHTSTGVVLGGGRLAADIVEGGAPRVDVDAGVVALPVDWLVEPADLRSDIERGNLAFLAPR